MDRSSVRVLVAEDFEPFRRFLSSTLRYRPDLYIISEVSDGVEAILKAQELQPDLVLLDIGLPKLNGIEAARQIRNLSPRSKILFVSQESSADVVQEALNTGAEGYVVKTDAGSELSAAVNAVLLGGTFVSRRFAGHDFRIGSPGDSLCRNNAPASLATVLPRRPESSSCHEARFYSDDASLVAAFTRFIGGALKAGNAAIVVATEPHRNDLLERLQEHGLDIDGAVEQGRFISLDAAETLSTFMVNDLPDPDRFLGAARNLITSTAKAGKSLRVAICGECDPPLWTLGSGEAAIQLEQLWNEIALQFDVDILCAYPLEAFHGVEGSHICEKICAEHSAVYSS
jgi:DNA-binding NarL/FixJ family response regulator